MKIFVSNHLVFADTSITMEKHSLASLKPITQFLFFSETKASSEIQNNLDELFIKDIPL